MDMKLSSNKARREKRKQLKQEALFKKLKLSTELEDDNHEPEPKKLTADKNPSTVSIAVAGSILDNAQSRELRTYLAGQIARAACIFQIDEIVVFDDSTKDYQSNNIKNVNDFSGTKFCSKTKNNEEENSQTVPHCCVQLVRILQYLECPQYLRKHIFPLHKDLQYAGLLNPLDAPHHLRQDNDFIFREGIITKVAVNDDVTGSYADVGLHKNVLVDKALTPGIRVTVRLHSRKRTKKLKGTIVAPSVPRAETGVYWGYNIRLANSLSQVFTQSPYKKGYDVLLGTSDKGTSIDDVQNVRYKHALIVFGGLEGLEFALENDKILNETDPRNVFDYYLNTLPNQGSRTIRTEEAILVTLATLRNKLVPKHEVKSP